MHRDQTGNFIVSCFGCMALVGLLTRKQNGDIIVLQNAPTLLSNPNRLIVIDEIKKGATRVVIDGNIYASETTWQRAAHGHDAKN